MRINYSIPREELIEVKTFGDLVKRERLERGLKQTELATKIGVNERTVVNWEIHGRMPRNGQREKLVEVLEINDFDLPTV